MTQPQVRILVVEDDVVDRMACRRALAQDADFEFIITEAETGGEGLQLAHAQKPDCVLLDFHLPDMDGLEFLAELSNDLGEIPVPVMMLTGADNVSVAVEAMKRGAQDYLVKDVNRQYLELLPSVVQRVLRERRTLMEKKQAEESLVQAEAKYRSLVEQIPAITYTAALDVPGKLLYVSPQLEALGYAPEEWVAAADALHSHVHPDDRIRAVETFDSVRVTGKPLHCEYRLLARNGAVLWFRNEAHVVRDGAGNPLFLQGILMDISASKQVEQELREHRYRLEELVAKRTDELAEVNKNLRQDIAERKRVQAELTNAKAAAEKANLAKSNFLSSMSHELRTPLNAILGFAQLLEAGSPPPTAAQIVKLHQITKAGWYLLELINEILDLAVIESGRLSLSREPIALIDVMRECQAMIESLAQQRDIKMTFLPFDNRWFINADRMRVKQVLINLLSNAIKYNCKHGTVEVKCTASTPERIRISIKDSGAGLPPEKLVQLFQPFNRLGQETGTEEGTGIGLVVTKQLVELMGGTIGVESSVGVGSEFWIELVSSAVPQLAASGSKSQKLAPKIYAGIQQHTLLYFEDNPANLLLVKELIAEGRPDMRLLIADNGKLGIELARTHLPDVILMDITLPDISGIEAMEMLLKDPLMAHIPVVALSANAMPHNVSKGMEAGFFHYICKPFELNEFMCVIDEALEFRKGRLASTNTTEGIEG